MFITNRVFPGITHITDAMGVSFTLIEGQQRALLFDTGYGIENVGDFIRSLTEKTIKVYLSHGHHDHILGSRWFRKTYLCEEDLKEFKDRTGEAQRRKIIKQAADRGITVSEDFISARIEMPEAIRFPGRMGFFDCMEENLGDLKAKVIRVPGHTPGSIMIHIPAYHLLLTGDNWNPCTWIWFPSSLNVKKWRNNMISVIRILEDESRTDIQNVICSHQPMIRQGSEMKAFLDYINDECLNQAKAVDMGVPINTYMIRKEPEDWTLVFDKDK